MKTIRFELEGLPSIHSPATTLYMPNIYHYFSIQQSPARVFENMVTAQGLDNWWTKSSVVTPEPGGMYLLDFGPGYVWKAMVTQYKPDEVFELEFTEADKDWVGTKVGFTLVAHNGKTTVRFYHAEWPRENEHFRISSYCWAMYLRILKRYLEFGEQVPYEKRLDV